MIRLRWLLLSGLAFALLFLAFPGLDIAASGLFFQPGQGFILLHEPILGALRRNLEIPLAVFFVLGLSYLVWATWRGSPAWLGDRRRQVIYLMLVLIVGPALLVNGVFKDHWGRARPMDVREFGGPDHFTPAWVLSDQCDRNCSFVCGDASVGFALVALGFISRRPRRWLIAGIIVGGLLGVMRMGQGGHFLSDVVFSFYAVYLAAWVVHRWLFNNPMKPTGNQAGDSR
jgi:lipid A 4'-phosphatase